MAIVSCGALIDVLRQLRLLDDEQLAGVFSLAGSRSTDVRTVAKSLIQRGWFTVYQMNQLLAGHGHELCFGPYVILDRLGRGGQSEVYKARHVENGWTVALKVVRASYLSSAASAQQFFQEMLAMAELEHPNIVQFWDVDKAGEAYYCAMEFIEGTDLGKMVQLQGRLAYETAAEFSRQTAMGLQHAYEHSIVHRDIKPANLYLIQQSAARRSCYMTNTATVSRAPLVKILDWGLASFPQSRREANLGAGVGHDIVGTADYMAPEQASRPDSVDCRADIYSLGCALYFLLTGHPPFGGTTVLQKIMKHQTEVPAPVESINPEVPQGLGCVLRRLMAKDPAERFQTPAAAALALAPFCRYDASAEPRRPHSFCPNPLSSDRRRPHDETPPLSATMPVKRPLDRSR